MKKNTWSDAEFQRINGFIHQQVRRYGRSLDKEECFSEAWRAFLEARYTYHLVAGCCSFTVYAERCITESLCRLRRDRNDRMSLESKLSLDMAFMDSDETVGARFFRKVNDCTANVALWDFVERQGEEKHRILRQMNMGMDDGEIMEKNHMDAQTFDRLLAELREAFREWQAI